MGVGQCVVPQSHIPDEQQPVSQINTYDDQGIGSFIKKSDDEWWKTGNKKDQTVIQTYSRENQLNEQNYNYSILQGEIKNEIQAHSQENKLNQQNEIKNPIQTYSQQNNLNQQSEIKNEEQIVLQTVNYGGTRYMGESPIIKLENIESIEKTCISIKESYQPWLKQRLEQLGIYEPIEKFVDDQSKFVFNTILPDQSKYEGYMKNGKRHGYGINLLQTELFEGSFQDGRRKGWGRRITKDTLESGYWENDKIQKSMKIQTKDIQYEGECLNSVPHRQGFLKRSISTYSGEFVNGRMEGQGKFEDLIENVKYEGEFVCDKYHGFGTYYFSSGKKYVGQFKNSLFNGQGEMFWPNNSYYKGEFVDGLFNGRGYYIDKDQSIFDGYWMNGKKHGKGKETIKNIVVQGIWENGVFQEGK